MFDVRTYSVFGEKKKTDYTPPPVSSDVSYIMYALVAYDGIILAQRQSPLKHRSNAILEDVRRCVDNAPKVLKKVEKEMEHDHHHEKRTLLTKKFNYHYMVDKAITYVCATPTHHPQHLAFAFLRDIKREWLKRYTPFDCSRAMAEQMTTEFKPVMTTKMMYYSDQTISRVEEVKEQVEDVTHILRDNIEKVTKRGEQLEMVEFKANEIAEMGGVFKKVTKKMKKKKCWQNVKVTICCYFMCGILLIMIVYLVGSLICGGWSWGRCRTWISNIF